MVKHNNFDDNENLHKDDKMVVNNVELKINPSKRNRSKPKLINATCKCGANADLNPILVRFVKGKAVFTCTKCITFKVHSR